MTIINGIDLGFKETHLDHLEDLPLLYGKQGMRDALDILSHILLNNLEDDQIQIKMDGRPTIFFGEVGRRRFVATKSIFNKIPKINWSFEEINDGAYPDNVRKILITALSRLTPLTPDVIYQAEVMHHEEFDLKYDEVFISMQPNVVELTVPHNNILDIDQNLGLCVHTVYDKNGKKFFNTPDVISNGISFYSNKLDNSVPYFDDKHILRETQSYSHLIDTSIFKETELLNSIYKFKNKCIREPERLLFCVDHFEKENHWMVSHRNDFKALMFFHNIISVQKESIIRKLNARIQRKFSIDGKLTGPEGYVIKIPGLPEVKLVNRKIFSHANFKKYSS